MLGLILITIYLTFLDFVLFFTNGITFLVLFPIGIFGIDYFKIHLQTKLMKKIDVENLSIQISIVSSFMSVLNILTLLFVGLVVKYNYKVSLILAIMGKREEENV